MSNDILDKYIIFEANENIKKLKLSLFIDSIDFFLQNYHLEFSDEEYIFKNNILNFKIKLTNSYKEEDLYDCINVISSTLKEYFSIVIYSGSME